MSMHQCVLNQRMKSSAAGPHLCRAAPHDSKVGHISRRGPAITQFRLKSEAEPPHPRGRRAGGGEPIGTKHLKELKSLLLQVNVPMGAPP